MQQISFIFVSLESLSGASLFRVEEEFSTCGAPAAGARFPADTVSKAARHHGTSVVHTQRCSAVLRASIQFKQTSRHSSLGQQGLDPSVRFSAVTKACCILFELFYTWHNCHLGI